MSSHETEEDDDVQQLLSELSRVSSSIRTSTVKKSKKKPGFSGRDFSMEDILSPYSTSTKTTKAKTPSLAKSTTKKPTKKKEILGVADDSELDASLTEDPCVLCYEDKVVLRSHLGTCIAIAEPYERKMKTKNEQPGVPKLKRRLSLSSAKYTSATKLKAFIDGNPTESACEFVVIGTALRAQSGVIKHAEVVALMCRSSGRYLGVFDRSEEDDDQDSDIESGMDEFELDFGDSNLAFEREWRVTAKRKLAGRREHWTIVEVDNESPERSRERDLRIAASTARMDMRAKELGYKAHSKSLAPSKHELPVAVRSSDAILLRSSYADGLFLSCCQGKLRLSRVPPETENCTWEIVKVPAPFLPLWSRERKTLNGLQDDSLLPSTGSEKSISNRAELEDRLVESVLYAMQGLSGDLIDSSSANKWCVKQVFDNALLALTERMLPICEYYVDASQFVFRRSRAEHGRVSHALAAAMRSLLREYQVLLAQLEHQKLTKHLSLQKLWFYIQPSMHTLEVLSTVAKRSGTATGGALLNTVHRLASRGGDAKTRAVYSYLVENAAVPYLEMLELWIYHGVIRDPYNEFMVCVDEDATKKTLREDFNARYWDSRYTLRGSRTYQGTGGSSDHIPFFVSRIAEKILTTGKYLNVVRECGRWVHNECVQTIPYTDESHAYDQIVSRAHDFASQTLLALLIEEEKLIKRLRSLKHYFLLDQGDFFVHFMDIANEELKKPVEEIAVSRLQSLLEMCLRGRNVNDPFQEDLACELVPYALIQHVEAIHEFAGDSTEPLISSQTPTSSGLHGVDAFSLDFKVGWPLSLVLSRQALTKYQLIFRHLFFCKHVERQLCTTWLAHQTTKELNLRSALGPDYCLRQRMLHFLQNFEYYVMFEVLEPRWHELEQRLAHIKTVDELMKHHSEFLDTCLRECLLTHQGLLKTLAKIMTTCLLFAEQIGRFADQLQVDQASMEEAASEGKGTRDIHAARKNERVLRKTRIKVQEQHIRGIVTQQSYRQMIRRSQDTFDEMLGTFMDDLIREATHGEYHSHLTNLCTRLDFNSYYKKK